MPRFGNKIHSSPSLPSTDNNGKLQNTSPQRPYPDLILPADSTFPTLKYLQVEFMLKTNKFMPDLCSPPRPLAKRYFHRTRPDAPHVSKADVTEHAINSSWAFGPCPGVEYIPTTQYRGLNTHKSHFQKSKYLPALVSGIRIGDRRVAGVGLQPRSRIASLIGS